ncbi:FkbM family methyltransferase [Clostridioides sp. ZZV14-6045]|uniref:FkbM family methyltransferase n=1 Tax=Clostridioides sp. ZZV14-6045 TaxID=2811489 RepID=UPI001D11AA2E|nr:FkbM family methyltransferase [Clostridioides sp. ZZV14-6045]
MKVSIIIPVYNVEKYLEQCLYSAVNQTLKDIEIIVVNDGSTDSSLEILDKYKNENIIIINQVNKGLAGARNSGLKFARGEYVYFLDSDDYIELNTMEVCYNTARKNNSEIIVFDATVFNDTGIIGSLERRTFMNEMTLTGRNLFSILVDNNCDFVATWMNFFKKSFLDKFEISFYEGILYEDILHTIKSFILADKVTYLPIKLYNYRRRDESITTKPLTIKNIDGHYISSKELYNFYRNNSTYLDNKTKKSLIKVIQYYYKLSLIDCDRLCLLDKRREIINTLRKSDNILDIELEIMIDSPLLYHNTVEVNNLINKKKSEGLYKIEGFNKIIKMRENTSDIQVYKQIFIDNEYELNIDVNPKVIIDAGANIGLATVYFKQIYPESLVIAIEPEKYNFELLKYNTHEYKKMIPLQAALWNEDTFVSVTDEGFGEWGFMTKECQDEDIDNVRSITIDKIMSEYNLHEIDILKIDIEGAEKEVFQNHEYWLPKTKLIIIELHDRMKDGCSDSVWNAINKYDFKYYEKGENIVFINNLLIK